MDECEYQGVTVQVREDAQGRIFVAGLVEVSRLLPDGIISVISTGQIGIITCG